MDAGIKTEGSQSGQEKLVKRSPLKIKQVVSLEEMQQRIDNGQCKIMNPTTDVRELSSEDLQDLQLEHDEEDFYMFCACEECLKYREVILIIINDHLRMRCMWNALRRIIIKFYRSIIESTAVNTLDVYDSLTEDNFSWLVNGVQDANRMQHLEFMSDLSLTENVMLVLLSAMFVSEDPHQLLELMSFQAECFVRAYSLGISDKIVTIGTGQSTTEVMMNYVLTGYENVCKVSDEMSRFLFAFENNHMKQFGMDWVLLNKRMYQRYVYASIGPTAECILRLKAEVSPERYSELVKVYIKFDEEMNNVNNSWREVWANLHTFHMSQEDQDRRKRLKAVQTIFEVIRKDVTLPYEQFIDIPNWETHEDKKLVWQNIVAFIKKRWPAADQVRLSAVVSIESCKLCNNPQEFHKDACTCVTCLIAGRPTISKLTKECKKEGICLKCSFTERVGKDGVKYVAKIFQKCVASKHGDIEGDGDNKNFTALVNGSKPTESSMEPLDTYHLSWIVFKHLKDRKPYPYKTIEEKFFCTDCKRTSCALAKKFINREISFCLAHHLMKNYQPYSITLDKLVETVPGVAMYKALSIFHDPESDDLILKTLWTFNTSLIASYFADADDDPSKPDIDQLKIVNNDIELPMEEHLEGKAKSKKFLDFFGKTLGILQSEEPNLSSVISPATLKQILLKQINRNFKVDSTNKKVESKPREICEEPPVTLEPELIKPREVVDNPKKKPPCCAEQHCKDSHINKKCSHDKDSSSRVSETRDRLRKKLSQMTNAKKNVKTISKNGTKSPLDLIKVLNKSPPSLCSLSKEMAKVQNKANVSKEINKSVAKANQEKEDKSILDVKQPERTHTNTKNELDTSENLDEWVKNKLSFIEGSGESKKPKPACNNKKAAKKAKQKLRKEEQKRVEELTDLRSQFHDLYFKEFKSKNELKEQKISKKKDKKRIGELETNIKKLSKAKSKIETNILELIATVKSANSGFKFSYLPTKEQRQEVLKKNAPAQPTTAPPKQSNKTKSTNTKSASNPSTVYYPTEPQFVPPSEFRVPAVHNVQVAYSNSSVADPLDPSKRIVTIRRVNLPNVPETQVTVTAKGPSPDKDKLLYTFINGQIVPATSLDVQKLSVLQPTVFPTQFKPVSLPAKGQHLKPQSNVQKNSALTEIPVAKTKTQLKKERKRAVKLALEMQKEEELKKYLNQKSASNTNSRKQNIAHVEKNASTSITNSRKQNNTPVKKISSSNNKQKNIEPVEVLPEKLNNKNKTKKNSNMEQNKISQSKCSSSDSGINSRENSASNGKQKEGKTSKQLQAKKQVHNPVQVVPIDDKQREKMTEKQKKVVDKGQFDNNQFKMLHMDEFSSESEESVIVTVVKPKLKKTQSKSTNNIQVQKSKPTKAESKDKSTKAESKEKPTKAESKDKSTKAESKEKPTKAESKEKPTKAVSKEKPNKAESKAKPTKAESKEKPTKAESKEKPTKVESKDKPPKESKEKPTKGAGKEKKPTCVRNVPAQNCAQPSAVWAAQTEENKKQKKKASKKQNRVINEANSKHHSSIVDKTATHADHIAKSLGRSMQKLNLNADTTMEFSKNTCDNPNTICNLNISIMEQLNRGVQVEDLTLPPGITLTKVDPGRAEALRAKTESIGKLSQPMQPQQQHKSMVTPIIPPSLLPHLGRFSADQSGVIMVDAMGSRSTTSEMLSQTENKKPKKNKRRSKKKKGENPNDGMLAQQKNNDSKMITLRNPMFHGPSMHNHVLSMPNRVPIAPLPMDQPAAIIKNENGMFTIRNPALHQAFSSGVQNNYRSFNPSFYSAPETCRNFSYFSDNISNNAQYSNGHVGPKCLSAIGSEVKTAQQQKKTGNQWQTNPTPLQNKNAYIGDHNLPSPLQQKYQQSNYYNNFEVFSPSSGLFDRNSHDSGHNCDESPPPSVSGFNHYLDDIPNHGRQNAKYDDMSFFRNLIPGQRLNSEVTIHNINESKFSADSPTHHVEITPISRPTSRSNDFSPEQENLHNKNFGGALGEYGDNLFAPNQMLNLNELESEDREVESFKRFSYGFEPPKEKPKANINVNDLLANSKNKPTNSSTSPYLDESLDSFVRNMNSLKLTSEEAINGTQETNRRSNWW